VRNNEPHFSSRARETKGRQQTATILKTTMKLISVLALILSGVNAQPEEILGVDNISAEELKAGIDSGACELTTAVSTVLFS
jgi:hypothetical protein